MPRPGDYRHRVEILSATETTDSIGTRVQNWNIVASKIWCNISHDFRPTDYFSRIVNSTYREDNMWFRTRRTDKVTTTNRLRHQGTMYEIIQVRDENGENEETWIMAREIKA